MLVCNNNVYVFAIQVITINITEDGDEEQTNERQREIPTPTHIIPVSHYCYALLHVLHCYFFILRQVAAARTMPSN